MNRLEKKCFVTVAGAHGLLFVILMVGPAFFVASRKDDDFKPITVYSIENLTDGPTQGGTPQDVRAIPLPPPPAPTVQPKPAESTPKPPEIIKPAKAEPKDLEPVKPVVKIKPEEHGDEPAPVKKKRETKLDPNDLILSKPDKNKKQKEAKDAATAKEAADRKRREEELKEFGNAIKTLNNKLSGSTTVTMPVGVGGGGAASINYRDLIASKYYNAWNPSFSLDENTPDVTVSITIMRDGSVTGHITKRSGVAGMDKSVQSVLDAVTFIEAFPPSFKEQQMTIPVIFNLQTKRQ